MPGKQSDAPPVEIDYADLTNPEADLTEKIARGFGSSDGALGLILVRNVPEFVAARAALLKAASRFAALPEAVRQKYENAASQFNVGWSHGKESMNGQPDYAKGSFYANPLLDEPFSREERAADPRLEKLYANYSTPNLWPDAELPELSAAFKRLGRLVHDVGCALARQCDRFLVAQGVAAPLVESAVVSGRIAKARLLHYYPLGPEAPAAAAGDSWCGWHLDHSVLTGLTAAMYVDERNRNLCELDPAADPVVASLLADSGLYIRTRGGAVRRVVIPRDALAFQMGECLQLMSNGALCATPHCVRGIPYSAAAPLASHVARNTFAVFMQPDLDVQVSPQQTFGDYTNDVLNRHYSASVTSVGHG